MAQNRDTSEGTITHHCMQTNRLLRIESKLGEMEIQRRKDIEKTAETLKGMASELNNALSFFNTTSKQIKLLFARINTLARSLEKQRCPK